MKLELPLKVPEASAYQYYAFPLAVNQTMQHSRFWMASNFIQMEFDKRGAHAPVPFSFTMCDYAVNPLLDVMSMSLSWFEKGDISNSLKQALKSGWYCYAFFDEFYLPSRESYRQWEFVHDALVHGYDPENNSFLVYGYDKDILLTSVWTDESDIRSAYLSAMEKDPSHARVVLYKPNPNKVYPLNIELIARTIDEYLTGFNTSEHYASSYVTGDFCYGVDTYEPLKDSLSKDFKDGEFLNLRNLQVLWEHKRLMVERSRVLSESIPAVTIITDPLVQIEQDAKRIRNSLLQARFSNQAVNRKALVKELDKIQFMEVEVLSRFLTILRESSSIDDHFLGNK